MDFKHDLNIFRRKSSGKTLDDIRDDLLSARSYIKSQMDGVYLMDGVIKRTTTEYVEEGGQIVEVKSKIIFWLCFMSMYRISNLNFLMFYGKRFLRLFLSDFWI